MLLSYNNVSLKFGARTILADASWHIFENERIGLIGANGTGKSTLLKTLVGEMSVSGGILNKSKNLKMGYFHQDLQSADTDMPILECAMEAYEDALRIQKELDALTEKMHDNTTDEMIFKQADLLHEFEVAGGYEMEYNAAQVLEGLGFKTVDLQRSFKEFSGGWRMRVLLAKMILQQPDILLLDEPTNHLDLPSIEWLERYFQNFPGTMIIVSHDRYFLDKMVTKIVEISQQNLIHYTGNYSFYETEKAVRNEFTQREFENQQEYIRQQERFVERFKAKASKAAQAQSIVKRLDRLDRIEAPAAETAQIQFRFEVAVTPGKIVSTLENVSKRYGEIEILNHAEAIINRGDRVALIGANGKGKSTLLRIINTTEEIEGTSVLGHNVDMSFYAQHQLEALDVKSTILQELVLCGSGKTEVQLRQLLGCFLFQGDDVHKKIGVLSGGEKARVALAKIIVGKGNFLMLDEPTNHLDMSSVNMLVEAINKYEGTSVLVSHDRYFVQRTANKIWEIEEGKIKVFDGTYDEWEEFKKRKQEKVKDLPKEKKEIKVEKPEINTNTSAFKQQQKEQKKVQNEFEKIEKELQETKNKKMAIELQMADPKLYEDKIIFQKLENDYLQIQQKIQKQEQEYEKIFEQLMSFENE
ncbi:MAG: ABC-F family ATP-binding cassette domain-containing protein [Chitinophagaceae bacterium]|nr:ABC-F family ATP-binding cassette domain-containing protein [Chitinophagaceae bacterium]